MHVQTDQEPSLLRWLAQEYVMDQLRFCIILFLLSTLGSQACAQVSETGLASFYSDRFEGSLTASGAVFEQGKMTAAHRSLPFQTKVRVTNLKNKKSVVVKINDRGPFVKDRVIDLSKAAAVKLDFVDEGVAKVTIEVLSEK